MGSSAPEPGPDTEDPANSPARVLVEGQLADPDATWTMGPADGGARFARRAGEPTSRGPGSAVTERGGIRLTLPDSVVAIAYETPSPADPLAWEHGIAFCLDVADAVLDARVGELGPDTAALRPRDTRGVLFDLGTGGPYARVRARTSDPAVLTLLRAGGPRPDLAALPVDVVVHTAVGRIEAAAGTRRAGADVPSSAPVPTGWVPCLVLRPAHPAADRSGRPRPFDHDRHAAFQALLAVHGDPVLSVLKADVVDAVRAGRPPDASLRVDGPAARATVAVTVRQLMLTDGTSGVLAAWRSRYGAG